jgi:hypothetical protein
MSRIDVSELLRDPDFVSPVTHLGRAYQVNGRGETVLQECKVETFGSVQPASGRTLNRLPEALRQANVQSFWLQSKIVSCEPGKYPDILIFKGNRYQVQIVWDWTDWGEGWCEGTCVAQRPAS